MNYDYLSSPILVELPRFQENQTEANTLFFIELESKDSKWGIEKTYGQFQSLVKNLNSYQTLPRLPPKNYFFRLSPEEMEKRRKGLQDFLRQLVIRNDLMNSPTVTQFLQLTQHASEIIANPPELILQHHITGSTKGINGCMYVEEESTFYLVTGETNPMCRLDAAVSNSSMPWQNTEVKQMKEVGSVEAWVAGDSSQKFLMLCKKAYPELATAIYQHNGKVIVGLANGQMEILNVVKDNFETVVRGKVHDSWVTGITFHNNLVISVSLDKSLKVSHPVTLSQVSNFPIPYQITCLSTDLQHNRIFYGTSEGIVYVYSLEEGHNLKLLITLCTNNNGEIKCMQFEGKRNYLFTGAKDGEINVFQVGKAGREKYGKMVATLQGKRQIKAITSAQDRQEIVTGCERGTITIWDAHTGKSIYVIKAYDCAITHLIYQQSSQHIIACAKTKSIKTWRLPKHWRNQQILQQQRKVAGQRVKQLRQDLIISLNDSDDNDLAGWHEDD